MVLTSLFSPEVHIKLDYDWHCAVIVKLMGKPNFVSAFNFMWVGYEGSGI